MGDGSPPRWVEVQKEMCGPSGVTQPAMSAREGRDTGPRGAVRIGWGPRELGRTLGNPTIRAGQPGCDGRANCRHDERENV